jgi:hypothetical protein
VVYVSLQDSDELLAIDLATQAPRWKIKVGKMPADVYLTPDDKHAARRPDRRPLRRGVRRVGRPARLLKRIATGEGAHAFRARGDGGTCSSATGWPTPSAIIDTAGLVVVAELPGPGGPDCMEVLADGKTLLVSSRWARKLSLIDIDNRKWCARCRWALAARRVDAGPCAAPVGWGAARVARCRPCAAWRPAPAACDKPVYLTFDTGHMGVAPLVAEVLQRQQVKAPSSSPTSAPGRRQQPGRPLGALVESLERAADGPRLRLAHLGPRRLAADRRPRRLRLRPTAGPAGRQPRGCWTPADYCAELQRPAARFRP